MSLRRNVGDLLACDSLTFNLGLLKRPYFCKIVPFSGTFHPVNYRICHGAKRFVLEFLVSFAMLERVSQVLESLLAK